MTMSRSVRIPTRRAPSITGMGPTSSCAIALAASATEASTLQVVGLDVITSRTCLIGTLLSDVVAVHAEGSRRERRETRANARSGRAFRPATSSSGRFDVGRRVNELIHEGL